MYHFQCSNIYSILQNKTKEDRDIYFIQQLAKISFCLEEEKRMMNYASDPNKPVPAMFSR
jgi:hypothetical protein